MSKTLSMSPDLSLPLDAVTQKFAFLGRTGSGKTFAATKLIEEMLAVGVQVVSLDPVGVHYGLRIAADGKSPGIQIPVFGGLHGDVPIESTGGKLIADLIIDRHLSAVVDVSQFESDAQKTRFAADFAERFFFRKKAMPSPVMLMMEECQEFIPENPTKDEPKMLHHFTRLCKLGRNFGIGIGMISQRPQEVNKKCLNLTECMFAFQMTGPHERKTIKSWVEEKGGDLDIVDALPRFEVGQAHVWSPQWLRISKTVKIGKKWTFNSSSTPAFGSEKRTEPKPLDADDLEKLTAQMADTIERAKAEDPKELRKKIAELEKAAKTAQPQVDPAAFAQAEQRGVEIATKRYEGELAKFRSEVKRASEMLAPITGTATAVQETLVDVWMKLEQVDIKDFASRPNQSFKAPAFVARPTPRKSMASTNGHVKLPPGERAVLTACATYPEGCERNRLRVLTGYKRSSRDAYIQRLREKGYVEDGPTITATPEGIAALGDFETLPTGSALQEYWAQKLPDGESKILALLIGAGGGPIPRDSLDEQTGYARSSRDAYIQRLKARGLVEVLPRGEVRADRNLFD